MAQSTPDSTISEYVLSIKLFDHFELSTWLLARRKLPNMSRNGFTLGSSSNEARFSILDEEDVLLGPAGAAVREPGPLVMNGELVSWHRRSWRSHCGNRLHGVLYVEGGDGGVCSAPRPGLLTWGIDWSTPRCDAPRTGR